MKIEFSKYQGTGNDFVLLDNRTGIFNDLSRAEIEQLCDRRFGIGADGLMMLNEVNGYDFEMKYFNADGAPGSMCGNGARCISAFALRLGIVLDACSFIAFDGPHKSKFLNELVSLKMNAVDSIKSINADSFLNTGSPHYITFRDSVMSLDVVREGRAIRNSPQYKADGVNVNFVEKIAEDNIFVRTYERGVEDETYSCGTGVTASAIAFARSKQGKQLIRVRTKGGELSVAFEQTGEGFDNIWLTGPADFVFSGTIELEKK